MNIDLDSTGLRTLVNGSVPYYDVFNHPLVKKAGHRFSDQYIRTSWNRLNDLTDEELYELYLICRNSWKNILKK
jgi:hypothetical protein